MQILSLEGQGNKVCFPLYIKFYNLLFFFLLDHMLQTSFLIMIDIPSIYGGIEFHCMGCTIIYPTKLLLHI